MTRPNTIRIATRIGAGLATAGAAVALTLAGAGAASAQQVASYPLAPGQGACVTQYASYQVRGDTNATLDGAKFKLMRNDVVVANTSNRQPGWAVELRSSYGTFPGPGYYQLCAQNTGTRNTIAFLKLRTDSEF
jgi:opacity protein-like surface antigen